MSRINERGEIIRGPSGTTNTPSPMPGGTAGGTGRACIPWWVVVIAALCIFFGGGSWMISLFQNLSANSNNSQVYYPTDVSIPAELPTNPSSVNPSKTKTPMSNPSNPKLVPISSSYQCPDRDGVKLQVGAQGEIREEYEVSLRERPIVPNEWDANIIRVLQGGEHFYVVGGPECAHDGTWWQIRTESGDVGWSREYTPSLGRLLLRVNP